MVSKMISRFMGSGEDAVGVSAILPKGIEVRQMVSGGANYLTLDLPDDQSVGGMKRAAGRHRTADGGPPSPLQGRRSIRLLAFRRADDFAQHDGLAAALGVAEEFAGGG